jgi:hypothetical protein
VIDMRCWVPDVFVEKMFDIYNGKLSLKTEFPKENQLAGK